MPSLGPTGPEFPHAEPYPPEQSALMEPPPLPKEASGETVRVVIQVPIEEEPELEPETVVVPVSVPVLVPVPVPGASHEDESEPADPAVVVSVSVE